MANLTDDTTADANPPRRVHILLLEDSNLDAELICSQVSRAGFDCQVDRVTTRGDFADALRRGGYDLVLADYSLPQFDGRSALALAQHERPDLPVIIVSGAMEHELGVRLLREGATDYVLKSNLDRLLPAVTRALVDARERSRRQLAEEALRASEETLRLVIDGAKDYAIFTLNADGVVMTWNDGAARIKGYQADEIIGRHYRLLYLPEDRASGLPERNLARAREDGSYDEERERMRKDGTTFWADVVIRPLYLPDGTLRGFSKVVRDVTARRDDRRRALDAERAARAEAERVSRMKDEFLATLGHELRTPLNAIMGWAQILNGGARTDEDLTEGLHTIERNARAQATIVNDLLDMSRIISGKVRLDARPLDLLPVVGYAVDTIRAAADAKGVRVHTSLEPGTCLVTGDPDRLQQVFWNVLANAVKFTGRGGHIHVTCNRADGHVQIGVADTGEGIPTDFLPHVFDRFRQSDSSATRRHGGLGLGLSIARQLVELHGGSIHATSDGPGRGSSFIVTLPAAEVQPATTGRHAPPADAAPRNPNDCDQVEGLRVLVVDDEPDALTLVRRLLEDCDAVVTTAASAAEALERLEAARPDVIVSDIGMPAEDGYMMIRKVRSLAPERGGSVPAIALTAYARPEDHTRSLASGFQHHLAKPVEPAELLTAVARLATRQ